MIMAFSMVPIPSMIPDFGSTTSLISFAAFLSRAGAHAATFNKNVDNSHISNIHSLISPLGEDGLANVKSFDEVCYLVCNEIN